MDFDEFLLDEKEIYANVEEYKEMNTIEPSMAIGIEEIIKRVCKKTGLGIGDITRKTKHKKCVTARKAIIILSDKYADVTNNELSKMLNVSPGVTSRIKGERNGLGDEVVELVRQVAGNFVEVSG